MNYQNIIEELTSTLKEFFSTRAHLFEKAVDRTCECLEKGHKILIFGNGGSAAQAQHFSAELINKFLKVRSPFRAIALTTDTSTLTSIGNDSSFDFVFSRQIEALGDRGDVAIALSTSGNSSNLIEAVNAAKKKGLITIALTGSGGGKMGSLPDHLLDVPSESTPRIQEVHILLLHLLAGEIEGRLA